MRSVGGSKFNASVFAVSGSLNLLYARQVKMLQVQAVIRR